MSERTQTQKMKAIIQEYHALRKKLFGTAMFVVPQKSPDWNRYNQLFQWMYPQYRTSEYVSPM